MTPRATPMAPDERRAAIVDAVLPLVLERGAMPSSREIADAAGIAEGTIYRAFEDKTALLHAVLEQALRPPDTEAELVALMTSLPDLHSRLEALADRSLARQREVMTVLMTLRPLLLTDRGVGGESRVGPPEFMVRHGREMHERLTRVLGLAAQDLRVDPATAAYAFRALVFGARHPGLPDPSPLTPAVIADLLVSGIGAPERTTP